MEQISTNSSVLDLDLSDIDDSESTPQSALINQRLAAVGGGGGFGGRGSFGGGGGFNGGFGGLGLGGGGPGNNILSSNEVTPNDVTKSETPPPKTSRNVIQMFSNSLPGRGKEMLSDAGLGVNRVVAMAPVVPQNQYWMLPGAIFDD